MEKVDTPGSISKQRSSDKKREPRHSCQSQLLRTLQVCEKQGKPAQNMSLSISHFERKRHTMPPSRRLLLACISASVILLLGLLTTTGVRHHQHETHALKQTLDQQGQLLHPPPPVLPKGPFYKPVANIAYPATKDNFLTASSARTPDQLPQIPHWNKPKHVTDNTPLFIGFTRNWPILQQAVVSYITAGWPPEDIYVVDNTVRGMLFANIVTRLTQRRAQ